MVTITIIGGIFCYLLYAPYITEATRAYEALKKKYNPGE